jgi:hypothetical protein
LHIGNEWANNNWHSGLLDEIRISGNVLDLYELGFNKSLASLDADKDDKLSTCWGALKEQ